MEKGLLRFGCGDLLYIVDDQDVYRLVKMDKVVDCIVKYGVGILRLKQVGRYIQHAPLGLRFKNPQADGVDQMRLTYAAGTVKKKRIEGRFSGLFGNG